MKKICFILVMLMIVAMCGAAMAEEKTQSGHLAIVDGLPEEGTVRKEKLPVEGTFFADYRLEYSLENGKYRLRSFSAWNIDFAGTLQGDFVYPWQDYAEYVRRPRIADAVQVECTLSADGLATVTFSYQLKRTQADGTTTYMKPMTTATTFQLPAE